MFCTIGRVDDEAGNPTRIGFDVSLQLASKLSVQLLARVLGQHDERRKL